MKIKSFLPLLAVTTACLYGEHHEQTSQATAIVCMNNDPQLMLRVRPLVSAMFASIDVKINWHDWDGSCPSGFVRQVRFSYNSTRVGHSGALAYAQPYGKTVEVFIDRFYGFNRNRVQSMMAHVLVHEIAHVLEEIDRHSPTGIMKAHGTIVTTLKCAVALCLLLGRMHI